MAHKKGQGSVKNGRDSVSKRLGVKKFGSEAVIAAVGEYGSGLHGTNLKSGAHPSQLLPGRCLIGQRGTRCSP